MRHWLKFLILTCSILTFTGCDSLHQTGKVRPQQETAPFAGTENFGNNWQFKRLSNIDFPADEEWEEVVIPHSVRIEPLVVNDQWQGISLYRKFFPVDEIGQQKWFFHFEGVMQEANVKINDSLVKNHKGGYLPFVVDATPFLKQNSENKIEVEVINFDDSSIPPGKPLEDLDFNYYGGIYRNVHLEKKNPIYITNAVHADKVNSGGVLIQFNKIDSLQAGGFIKTHLKNDTRKQKEVQIRATLTGPEGDSHSFLSSTKQVKPGEDMEVVQDIIIKDPHLWSPDSPSLYDLKVELLEGQDVLDYKKTRTGIRSIELTEDGFYLNGKRIFLNGTNRHQEYPFIGYALSDEANYRDAYKIKEAGFNFVRLSHYPQTTAFYEAADELGLLLMDAIAGWQYYEEGEFVQNALRDIQDMVRRDRNHPSVVFWENSLNESGMTDEFIEKANLVLKAELPYEDTYSAGWMDHPAYDLFIPARQHAKPPYYWNAYDKPNRPILIAEYGDWEYYAQNAGFNQKAFSDLKEEERTSRQLRGTGEKRLLQQALNFQEATNSNLKGAQTIGMANWLMFDYNRGYADDLEASGIADIFRIPKFSYYFYKSQKDPGGEFFSEPVVFIASYWQPDSSTEVTVFSNAEEVALFLNDSLIGKKRPQRDEFSDALDHPPFKFQIPAFRPGELRAVGFIDESEVASHSVTTPQEPVAIELEVDISGKEISTEHLDVVFVYAKILDENGTVVPSAEMEVFFEIEEEMQNVELIGENPVKAEAGIATILLRTKELKEPVIVRASSGGMKGASIRIE